MTQLKSNVLYGAAEISEYLFGTPDHATRVWDLRRRANFPFFKLGGTLCARVSAIEEWTAKQEAANAGPANDDRAGEGDDVA